MTELTSNLFLTTHFLLILVITTVSAWTPSSLPKFVDKYDEQRSKFVGNLTDYFKVLDQDDYTLLIGARNALYNISMNGLIENTRERIEWKSSDAHRELCTLKGKSEAECHNYVRVFARISDSQILLCGTNSYKPLCRYYNIQDVAPNSIENRYKLSKEIEAQGRCPYNPKHNSTYIFANGHLYSATVADFSGGDPLIYRDPQRTEQFDFKQLNQPAFVSAVDYEGYVFFFFREVAMEYMNCGKTIYSRVGRVCKNDKGGPHSFAKIWTSFLKSRLNCSMPGEFPFYFDEIQATTKIIEGIYGGDENAIIYMVMTTPVNAIGGSAVCAFAIRDILDAFDGRFRGQKTETSNWLPVPEENVPSPRPGVCVNDSRTLPSMTVNFARSHTLMDTSVSSLYGQPLFVKVSLQYRLTAIAVDPQVEALNGKKYDVVFVGTDDGRVIKFTNSQGPNSLDVNTTVISETQAFKGIRITDLRISKTTNTVIVLGQGQMVSIPLFNCNEINKLKPTKGSNCWECLGLQDPYCMWNKNHECVSIYDNQNKKDVFIQDLTGKTRATVCSKYAKDDNLVEKDPIVIQKLPDHATLTGVGRNFDNTLDNNELANEIIRFDIDDQEPVPRGISDPTVNQVQTHVASVGMWILVILLATIVGVIFGIAMSKRCSKNDPFPSEHHRNQLSWTGKSRPILPPPNRNSGKDINLLMNTTNTFTAPCNNKKDNLELELDSKDRNHECKNSTESLEKEIPYKTGTLQKVKKTYI